MAIVRDLAQGEPIWKTYRHDGLLGTSMRAAGRVHELTAAIETAVRAVAERDPDTIATFVQTWETEETLSVHRILMTGLRASLPASAPRAIEYLQGDPRRLVVGDWNSHDRETTYFIKALAPHIPADQMPAIEQMLSQSTCIAVERRDNPHWRRKAHDGNRRHRLRLLLALGRDCRLLAFRTSSRKSDASRISTKIERTQSWS